MASINPDIPSSPTQRKTNKRRLSKAAASQPLEVVLNDDEPATAPAKRPRKASTKKNQVVVTSEINEQDDKNSGAFKDVKENNGSCSGNYVLRRTCRYVTPGLRQQKTPSTPPTNPAELSGLEFMGTTPSPYLHTLGLLTAGKTLADRLPAAFKLYAGLNKGKDYSHIQCYHILSVSQKWLDYCESLEQKRLADLKKNNPSSDNPQSDLASDTTAVPSTRAEESGRPTGNKKAKEARVQELQDTKWKDNLVKVNRDLANHSETQSAILAEQKEALVAMSDEATMLIDLDNIPEAKHEFFEWRQQKVMEKMRKSKAEEARKKKEEEEKKKKEEEEKKKKEEEEKKKKEDDEKNKKADEEKARQAAQKKTSVTLKKNIAAKKKTTTATAVPKTTAKATKAVAEVEKRAAEAEKKEQEEAAHRILEELDQEEEGVEGEEDDKDNGKEGEDEEEDEEEEIEM
ncbi:hypothetical protein Pst134EB_026263 [Puccinia striiformis f. sp. tritici]|nr:hypothetical protein Pst134EB_026263 [Puccinia striiformis f. sp. tritici]